MSIYNENISLKIKDIKRLSWNSSVVTVAPRPFHALALRLRGRAEFFISEVHFCSEPEEVFFLPAGLPYRAQYEGENEILVVHFESDYQGMPENYTPDSNLSFEYLFKKIYEIWENKSEGYYFEATQLLCDILKAIRQTRSPEYKNETYRSFMKGIEYMETNYTSPDFSVAHMVSASYMSNTYFRKLFLTRFGDTPSRYVIKKRLERAEFMLASGKYTIAEIAGMCGFADTKYFSRAVKKEYGFSPSELYRHDKKQGQ